MSNIPRLANGFSIDPSSMHRVRRWAGFGARLVFWPIALLTLASLALQCGAWQQEFRIAGPFAAEANPPRHSLLVAVPQEDRAAWWRQPLLGDDSGKPSRSFLELAIDGHQVGPPHSQHEAIRAAETAGFSHWGAYVIFSLPPGVKNGPETIATLRYSIKPRAWVSLLLTVLSGILGWFQYGRTLKSLARGHGKLPIAVALGTPYLILFVLCAAALIASVAYLLASLAALTLDWALPTTALIRWSSIAQWAARSEPYLGSLVLSLAALGAAVTWLAGLNAYHRRSVEFNERTLRRVLAWCGFPIVASALVLCISAMWAGFVRPGDPNYSSIGGLIPFSDAANYLTAAFDQARDGVWNTIALRRPLAAAFRSDLLFFAYYSLQAMLLLQAGMLAAAIAFAAYAVATWRGIWAGIAFFALTYIYSRTFVSTTLTEPPGLFWALLSIPFFIDAFVSGSARPALIAFALTTVALMTRMGSMFTIPALMLWLVWQFGQTIALKARILAAATCILLTVLGLNYLLQNAYGTGAGDAANNFAYVLCGLSIGTNWEGCLGQLGSGPRGSEAIMVNQLYSLAWENIQARPDVFLGRLAEGAQEFTAKFPYVLWRGYTAAIEESAWLFPGAITVVSLTGLLYIGFRRAKIRELTFWLLFWISILASASVIYLDDGARALAASVPLIALFFAMGLTSPVLASNEQPPRQQLWGYGTAVLLTAVALFVCVPWLAHYLYRTEALLQNVQAKEANEFVVFGGRRISGFLVVENGLPLRNDVPSMHLSDLKAILKQSGVAIYQDLLDPVIPPLPFGFVFTPRMEKGETSRYQYIVPPEVLERHDVPAWRFKVEPWGKPGLVQYWFYVAKAEPIR